MRTAIVYNFLIEANIMASIAILLMIPLRKLFRGKLGNSAICFGWLLVAVRLLLPLSFANPIIDTIRPPILEDEVIRPIAGQVLIRTRDAINQASLLFERAGNRAGAQTLDRVLDGFYFGTASLTLFRIYLLGLVIVAGWFIFSNVLFRSKIRAGRIEPISGKLLENYLDLCRERKVKPVPVFYTDPLPSACLLGVFRPYIALPLTASPSDAIHVLTHEICHLKNHDHLWALLRLVCCALHWFNPLVWIGATMCRTDSELRCDDRVVAPLNQEQKQAYANVLVLAASRRNAPGVAVLATGMTMTGRKLKKRLMTVLKGKQPLRWLTVTFCVVASMCLVCAFATSELPGKIQGIHIPFAQTIIGQLNENVRLNTRDEAASYATKLWMDVLDGDTSEPDECVVTQIETRYLVAGKTSLQGTSWYIELTDKGLITYFFCENPTIGEDEYINQKPADHREEVNRAQKYLMNTIETLNPGTGDKVDGPLLNEIRDVHGTHFLYFTILPKEDLEIITAVVQVDVDNEIRLIEFYTEGNG